VIVDTSALLALFDSGDKAHEDVARVFSDLQEPTVVSPYVVAETDYLVATRIGVRVELLVLQELARGGWELAPFDAADLDAAASVIARYANHRIGVADASLVVLAHKYGTRTIATLDRRHFNVIRPLSGGRFRLLP
jgi:uncharacterized protein